MTDKVIISNNGALRRKYGAAGYQRIRAAIRAMIAKDKTRGLSSKYVAVDSKTQMKSVGGPDVQTPGDEKAVKQAVDAIADTLAPDYILLLGAPDVIPHQTLTNQTGDEDPDIPSDLPYASKAPYGRAVRPFLTPTRVVGRLPGLQGSPDAGYLVRLIATAAGWTSKPASGYAAYFGLTARAWVRSTEESLDNTFGDHAALFSSPPRAGSTWTAAQLAPLAHFVNCHGASVDPSWYGDPGFPVAHDASRIRGRLKKRTVVAAECCYGAQLYDPSWAASMGICSTYLGRGAYAFFGSTTIAYGPASGNGYADVIAQGFLQNVGVGMSTGRAALEARQDYVASSTHADPVAEKTAAQFLLLGDPSVHPVRTTSPTRAVAEATGGAKGGAAGSAHALPVGRAQRRLRLESAGDVLDTTLGRVTRKAKAGIAKYAAETIARLLGDLKLEARSVTRFDVSLPATLKKGLPSGAAAKQKLPVIRYYLVDTPPQPLRAAGGLEGVAVQPKGASAAAGPKAGGPAQHELVLLREVDGKIEEYRRLYRR